MLWQQGLVERLATVEPAPIELEAKGAAVRVSYPNGLWTETDLAQIIDQPGVIERHIETASHKRPRRGARLRGSQHPGAMARPEI